MNNVFEEYKITPNLQKIEYDEIIKFIKDRFLSIRFFVRFLEKYKSEIERGDSVYHLLLKYYQEETYFNLEKDAINNSLYNILRFPKCMNDIEMLFQCKKIKIFDNEYNNIVKVKEPLKNYDIITNAFSDIISKKGESIAMLKEFYKSELYPRLDMDPINRNNNTISIGNTLKPINLKMDLDNYLISYGNNEMGMVEKRCYFSTNNFSNNYEIYKINQVEKEKTKPVSQDSFIPAYIACFLRDNKDEIRNNYPMIYQLIEEYTSDE